MYGCEIDHIFVVDALTDKLFETGFRIVNPEFNSSHERLRSDLEVLNNILMDWDATDPGAYDIYKKNKNLTPKERVIFKQVNGLDR